jgi:myo-inositol-1(or 4)-monophosphatase
MAAGLIILKEAGGFVESIHPGGNSLEDGTLIAANDQIFTQLAKAVRKSG